MLICISVMIWDIPTIFKYLKFKHAELVVTHLELAP